MRSLGKKPKCPRLLSRRSRGRAAAVAAGGRLTGQGCCAEQRSQARPPCLCVSPTSSLDGQDQGSAGPGYSLAVGRRGREKGEAAALPALRRSIKKKDFKLGKCCKGRGKGSGREDGHKLCFPSPSPGSCFLLEIVSPISTGVDESRFSSQWKSH